MTPLFFSSPSHQKYHSERHHHEYTFVDANPLFTDYSTSGILLLPSSTKQKWLENVTVPTAVCMERILKCSSLLLLESGANVMNRPHLHIFAANAVFKALMPMIFLCTFVTTDIVLSIQMTPSLFPLPHLSPELSPLRPRRVTPTCTSTTMVLPWKTWILVPALSVYARLPDILVEANRPPHLMMMETVVLVLLLPTTLTTSFLCIP